VQVDCFALKIIGTVHLSERAGNSKGRVYKGCRRIAELDVAGDVGNDPLRVLVFELLVRFCAARFVTERIDFFLSGCFRELSAFNAEVSDEPDLFYKRALSGRNDHMCAEA